MSQTLAGDSIGNGPLCVVSIPPVWPHCRTGEPVSRPALREPEISASECSRARVDMLEGIPPGDKTVTWEAGHLSPGCGAVTPAWGQGTP